MAGSVSSQGSAFYASEIVSGQSGASLYLHLDWSLSTTPGVTPGREVHAGVYIMDIFTAEELKSKPYRNVTNRTKCLNI